MSRTSILGSVAVKLGLQSKGFDKQIKTAQLSLKRFGRSAERMGKNLSLTVTGPLAGLAAQSIRLFDKQAKAIAQVEQGLKSTGNAAGFTSKQLQDMASAMQGRTIFGDEDILKDVTAQLLTFTNISGDAFERTQQAALDLATRLDGDLKSASIQLGKALNDPVANLSALSRSGIQFTAQQKALIKELVETNRLADAQSIILDELNKQYGGSAEAARKAGAGGLQALQNSFGDILERVGAALLPLLNKLVAFFDGMLTKVNNLTDSQIQFAAGIGMVAAAIGPALLVVSALTKAFIAMGAPLALKIAGILALASGINYVYQNAGAFADRFVYAFNIAKEAVLEMTATAIDALGSLTSVFDLAGGTALKTMAMGIRSGLGNVKKDFTEFKGFGESLMDTFSMLGDKMSGVFSKLFAPSESSGIGSGSAAQSGPRFGTRIGTASGGLSNDQSGLLQANQALIDQQRLIPIVREQFFELSNMQIAQAQAIGQAFDGIADSFARTFVDGVTGLKSFGDMWKNLSKSIVNGLKEIAVQLLKMAALRGIASIFGLGGVFTGFDLAKGLIQKSNIFGGGSGSATSSSAAPKLNANLFIDGMQVQTATNFTNYKSNQLGF